MTSLIELLTENEKKIREIVLTEYEREQAYFEGQKKRFFHERNKHHWNDLEKDFSNKKDQEEI